MMEKLKAKLTKRNFFLILLFLLFCVAVYFIFFSSLTFSPVTEKRLMEQLEETKKSYQLALFQSDGCSGGVSKNWTAGIEQFSKLSDGFAVKYDDAESIPFEAACIEHDRAYHSGIGGYAGRLKADNELRQAILTYAIEQYPEIQSRTGLNTPEQAIYLYEIIAEAVYRGVRLGGAPCTEETYAWGYGYNRGSCVEE